MRKEGLGPVCYGSQAYHQQPDVNYIQILEKVDFPCTVNAQHLPFKGNQLRAITGQIVHFWLLVVGCRVGGCRAWASAGAGC